MNYESTGLTDTAEGFAPDRSEDFAGYDPADRRSGKLKWFIVAVLIIGAVAALAYYMIGNADDGATAAGDEASDSELPVVTVISPGRVTVAGTIRANGTFAARRDIPVGVEGEGGRVVAVSTDEGQWVRQGQVLVSIDRSVQNQQASGSAAQIQVAQADARLAQSNLDRALKLVDRGFISTADVDRLTATRDAANARVRVAQAQLGELRARTSRLNIVAPAAGYVLERNVEQGQTVGAGSPPLFRIARGGEMELMARLDETDLARISTGVSAEVTPVGTDKIFTGEVWQIAPTIDQQNRQGIARIALPYATELRPGGFANATINSGTVVAPVLPESALLSDDEGSYVYIVGKGNKIERRAIKLGEITAKGVIIANGLSGTERVVLRSGGFRNPGETVKPVKAKN